MQKLNSAPKKNKSNYFFLIPTMYHASSGLNNSNVNRCITLITPMQIENGNVNNLHVFGRGIICMRLKLYFVA